MLTWREQRQISKGMKSWKMLAHGAEHGREHDRFRCDNEEQRFANVRGCSQTRQGDRLNRGDVVVANSWFCFSRFRRLLLEASSLSTCCVIQKPKNQEFFHVSSEFSRKWCQDESSCPSACFQKRKPLSVSLLCVCPHP